MAQRTQFARFHKLDFSLFQKENSYISVCFPLRFSSFYRRKLGSMATLFLLLRKIFLSHHFADHMVIHRSILLSIDALRFNTPFVATSSLDSTRFPRKSKQILQFNCTYRKKLYRRRDPRQFNESCCRVTT